MITGDSRNSNDKEIVELVSKITDPAIYRIEERLPHGFVRLKVAEAERRQAIHDIRTVEDVVRELVRNSRDADASNVLVATQKEKGRHRKLAVIDDGCGIPEEMHEVVFEPRVTSKSEDFEEDRYGVHGRGMALFAIRARALNARVVASAPGCGTVILLDIDTNLVKERSDQASLPRIELKDGDFQITGGQKNIQRLMAEMSLDSPHISFFIGSFAEVVATLRVLQPVRDGGKLVWWRICASQDARELKDAASELGLEISERNAYRLINGEISPLDPYREVIKRHAQETIGTYSVKVERARRFEKGSAIKRIPHDEVTLVASDSKRALDSLLSRYYMKVQGQPKVRRGRGKITFTFRIIDEEWDE